LREAIFDRVAGGTVGKQAEQRDRAGEGIAARTGGAVGLEIVEEGIDPVRADMVEDRNDAGRRTDADAEPPTCEVA